MRRMAHVTGPTVRHSEYCMATTQPLLIKLNDSGRVCDVSQSAADLLGRGRNDVIGLPSVKLIWAPDVGHMTEGYWHAVRAPGERIRVVARLDAPGEKMIAEFVLMNLGSISAPDVIVELRPQLPEPPRMDGQGARFLELERVDGLNHIEELLQSGSNEFLIMLIRVKGDNCHEAPEWLVDDLTARARENVRDGDEIFRLAPNLILATISGIQTFEEVMIVLDRIQAAVSFPIDVGGTSLAPRGAIGVALANQALTAEYLLHWAEAQLEMALADEGQFPFSIERRQRPRV